jgi:hypothetical protein
MPIPQKGKKENNDKFLERCMSDNVMKKEFPNNKQRYAVCNTKLKKAVAEELEWSEFQNSPVIIY